MSTGYFVRAEEMVSFHGLVQQAAEYTAIPFAMIGFGITFWQLSKTRRAAELARDAARLAQSDISRGSLLILIPQLQRVEEELERAVRIDSADMVLSWLGNWRWQAGQARGLLAIASPGNRGILKALQSSLAAAAIVRSHLIDSSDDDSLAAMTRPARDAITNVTNQLG